MDKVLDFLADNYFIFIVISGVLLLALIGFIVTGRKKKKAEVQTADPMAQPVAPEMPSAPMDGEMPVAPTEAVTPDMNASVTPDTVVSTDVSSVQDTVAEPQVSMEPTIPSSSDEPTLIIEDKSATPETPVETSNIDAPVSAEPLNEVTPEVGPEEPAPLNVEVPAEAQNDSEPTSIFENQ